MMYSVSELLKNSGDLSMKLISVYGYIVIRDEKLVLLKSDYDREDWKKAPYVMLIDSDVQFAIIDQFPVRGGGVSLLFDQCVVDALVQTTNDQLVLDPSEIFIRSDLHSPFKKVDFGPDAIKSGIDKWKSKAPVSDLWP